MSRKKLIIIVILLAALVVVGIINLVSSNKKAQTTSQVTQNTTATSVGVIINNFSKDTGVYTSSVRQSIETAITTKAGINSSLTGQVREGSLAVTAADTAQNTRFIVDLPSVKRSYVVSLGQDPSTGEVSLYILCPAVSELIYPSFNCVDSPA